MAQSDVELLLTESDAPQLTSRWPLTLALNLRVSIFSRAWMAIRFMELWQVGKQLRTEEEREEKQGMSEWHATNFFKLNMDMKQGTVLQMNSMKRWGQHLDLKLNYNVMEPISNCIVEPHLAASLLELYLDEEDETNQRHHNKERQEDSHVKILCGLQ